MDINNSAASWADMLEVLKDFTPDFMVEGRQQPPMQVREEQTFIPKQDLDNL